MNHLIQTLEPRQLFAVFNGTPGSDTIIAYVDANGRQHVSINDVDLPTFDAQININGLGGDDNISIEGVRAQALVQIDGGEGSNRIYIGNGDFDTHIKGNIDVLGQQGTDFVVIEDASDQTNDPDQYEYTSFTFRKAMSNSALLSLFSVEEVIVNASNLNDSVKIFSTAAGSTLTWNGNGGIDHFELGNGNLGQLKGRIYLNGGAGHDTVSVFDHAAPGAQTYDVFNHTIERAGMAPWEIVGTIEALNLVASSGDDVINVRTSTGSITTGLSGHGGNDTFNLFTGGYTSPTVQNPVRLFGDAGNDTVNWNVQSGQHLYTVKSSELNGPHLPSYIYSTTETLNVNGGSGNELYIVYSTGAGTHTIINAGDGNDAIGLGGAFGQPWRLDDIDGTVAINGGAGFDSIDFADDQSTTQRTYSIHASVVECTNMADVAYGAVESIWVHGGTSSDTFEVTGTRSGTEIYLRGQGGSDTFNVNETAPDGWVVAEGGAGYDFVNVNLDHTGFAEVRFLDNEELQKLDIGAGGLATIHPSGQYALLTRELSIADQGRLDLTTGHLLLDYPATSPAAAVRSWLIAGRNGGAWNGASGIVSSAVASNPGTTLGYAETSDLFSTFPVTWAGYNVDSTTVGVSFTRAGDTTLNGSVGLADFNRMASNFGMSSGAVWSQGDFNYDGRVNLADFNLLAANFGQTASPSSAASGASASRDSHDELVELA